MLGTKIVYLLNCSSFDCSGIWCCISWNYQMGTIVPFHHVYNSLAIIGMKEGMLAFCSFIFLITKLLLISGSSNGVSVKGLVLRWSMNPAPLIVVSILPGLFLIVISFFLPTDQLCFVVVWDAICWVSIGILMCRLLVISPRPAAAVGGALLKCESPRFVSSGGPQQHPLLSLVKWSWGWWRETLHVHALHYMVLLRALLLPARCIQLIVDATSKDWSLHSRPLTSILSQPYLYQCGQRWDLCYTVAINIQSMPPVLVLFWPGLDESPSQQPRLGLLGDWETQVWPASLSKVEHFQSHPLLHPLSNNFNAGQLCNCFFEYPGGSHFQWLSIWKMVCLFKHCCPQCSLITPHFPQLTILANSGPLSHQLSF